MNGPYLTISSFEHPSMDTFPRSRQALTTDGVLLVFWGQIDGGWPVRQSIIVVDDFYRKPDLVRRYALNSSFYYPYQSERLVASGAEPSWLTTQFREAKECPFKSSTELTELLEDVTGEEIDKEHWQRSFPLDVDGRPADGCENDPSRGCLWNCSFHIKPHTGQQLGEGVHNHVTDIWNSVGEHGWAGLIYLNPVAPLSGGLHLWQNKDPVHNFDWMTDPENWILRDTFANVFNRLVLVRGDVPHSGADGWSSSVQEGRLYQTFFFRVVSPPGTPSLDLQL